MLICWSLCEAMHVHATNLSRTWRRIPAGIRNGGLNLGVQCAGRVARSRESMDSRVRWLELRNKMAAYRLFEGYTRAGGLDQATIVRLDTYSRLFAAEGYGYRNGSNVLHSELPRELSPIAVHAGVGLRLAEQTLTRIDRGEGKNDSLDQFLNACRENARAGFNGIMEESLGLVSRTLFPHLIESLDQRLRATSSSSGEYFWHGVGRGIYFVPQNVSPSRAAPWQGLRMCSTEPPHQTGKLNAHSGFCFALTLVNLREPDVLDVFCKHQAADLDECSDGINAAIAVWALSGGEVAIPEPLAAEYCCRPERLFAARRRRS